MSATLLAFPRPRRDFSWLRRVLCIFLENELAVFIEREFPRHLKVPHG